ncbi:MAG: dTDP-4-dehydrorhamnose reductase [bacterium]
MFVTRHSLLKILVAGSKGMLGTDLVEVLGLAHSVIGVDIDELDITDRQAVEERIGGWSPDLVINAAAYTDVDASEREPALALRINAEGVENLALACRSMGVRLIHLSTDYVFDGKKASPYVESDRPHPMGAYGKSKWEGEQRARRIEPEVCIVRTAWLYGQRGRNFVRSILEQSEKTRTLRVVRDQTGSPTYTRDLAQALKVVAEKRLAGVYHVTNQGSCTWFDFARKILELAGRQDVDVVPISTEELGRSAPRPSRSVLDCTKFQRDSGLALREWPEALRACLLSTQGASKNTH